MSKNTSSTKSSKINPPVVKEESNQQKRNAAKRSLGIAAFTAVVLNRAAARLEKQAKRMTGWSAPDEDGGDPANDARDHLDAAAASLRSAANALSTIPSDWKPAGKRGAGSEKSKFEVGAIVSIREKAMSKYADAFSNGEGKSLTVEKMGTLCVCKTSGGDRVFLKRGDLVLAPGCPNCNAGPNDLHTRPDCGVSHRTS